MNLPVTLVGFGSGVSYDDSGPTHHAVDDLAALRILPNLKIHNITDSVMAKSFADISVKIDSPNYVRLDREILPTLYDENTDFAEGLSVLIPGRDRFIAATGNMVHRALDIASELKDNGINIGVIDIYTFPVNSKLLIEIIKDAKQIITLEEHTLAGGLGSAVCEILADNQLHISVKRLGMDFSQGYCYRYGGRENIQKLYGLGKEDIVNCLMN